MTSECKVVYSTSRNSYAVNEQQQRTNNERRKRHISITNSNAAENARGGRGEPGMCGKVAPANAQPQRRSTLIAIRDRHGSSQPQKIDAERVIEQQVAHVPEHVQADMQ